MPTETTSASVPTASEKTVAQAVDLLTQGHLIGLPTETVYALAALLTKPPAISRLKNIKKLTASPNWVIHVAQAQAVTKIIASPSSLAMRLMKKLWPGPLAIELPATPADLQKLAALLGPQTAAECVSNGFITFRSPQNSSTLAVLAALPDPVAMIGAGNANSVHEAADIPSNIRDALSMVIDTGPTRYRKSSTLIRVQGDQLTFLRDGILAKRIIERMTDHVILFVCSGNTCRSPMAAGIAAVRIAKKLGTQPADLPLRHILVESAGIFANPGMPATPEAVEAARKFSADVSHHRARRVTPEILRRADVVFTMTRSHRSEIIAMLPEASAKTFTLEPNADIADPIGAGVEQYHIVASHINELINSRLVEIFS